MGGLEVGSVRDICLTSELPVTFTTEVLEHLDDSERILGIRSVGGDHILKPNRHRLTLITSQALTCCLSTVALCVKSSFAAPPHQPSPSSFFCCRVRTSDRCTRTLRSVLSLSIAWPVSLSSLFSAIGVSIPRRLPLRALLPVPFHRSTTLGHRSVLGFSNSRSFYFTSQSHHRLYCSASTLWTPLRLSICTSVDRSLIRTCLGLSSWLL
ncbi:hypothetical protein LUZ63_005080 [Rhynchospora breviuscula]|uniref:Uncharacterized protein n=1 Tax=Rhynchospora breviuscula TaxID=2022672 RepID=A0A9Q0HSS8_9POAL|nr:hypothetical protein LUZ63_005080 [Rhynchospora breviuscula]